MLIFAYTVPAVFISFQVTGVAIPQIAFGSAVADGSGFLLEKLDRVVTDLGFAAYTAGTRSRVDLFCTTLALMIGILWHGVAALRRARGRTDVAADPLLEGSVSR